MRLNHATATPPALFSMQTQEAEIQVVASSRGLVLDVQSTSHDTLGHARKSHTTTLLHLDEALRLETLLGDAIGAAWDLDDPVREQTDPRQTALWSPATFTKPSRRRRAA